MSDRLELFDVLVPAGTAKATPQRTALPFDPGRLRKWQVVIPDGPAGLVGFHFDYGGQQLIPNTAGAWITGNDERIDDTVGYQFVGAQWSIVAYNTDVWAHTLHVRMYVDEINDPAGSTSVIPDVLPVTINPGTVDLSAPDDTGADLTLSPPPDLSADATTSGDGTDTAPADDTTTITPLDLPADAPPVADDGTGTTDTTDAELLT